MLSSSPVVLYIRGDESLQSISCPANESNPWSTEKLPLLCCKKWHDRNAIVCLRSWLADAMDQMIIALASAA